MISRIEIVREPLINMGDVFRDSAVSLVERQGLGYYIS